MFGDRGSCSHQLSSCQAPCRSCGLNFVRRCPGRPIASGGTARLSPFPQGTWQKPLKPRAGSAGAVGRAGTAAGRAATPAAANRALGHGAPQGSGFKAASRRAGIPGAIVTQVASGEKKSLFGPEASARPRPESNSSAPVREARLLGRVADPFPEPRGSGTDRPSLGADADAFTPGSAASPPQGARRPGGRGRGAAPVPPGRGAGVRPS
jgi:hypothetical protein